MVQNVSHIQNLYSLSNRQSHDLNATSVTRSSNSEKQQVSTDRINLQSEATQTLTYSSSVNMSGGDKARYGMLQNLVANLLHEQGINTKIAIGDTEIDLSQLSQEEAQELIGEDGYFGVEQTSDRIFQFAVGIAGGDPSRIDAIKEGINQGFAEAKEAFGDWLPDISYDTYDAVMTKLDAWVAESQDMA